MVHASRIDGLNSVAFLSWVASVERILGHDLNGHWMADGYSMEDAEKNFLDGLGTNEYARKVQIEKNLRTI
jgi:hypothetical protein